MYRISFVREYLSIKNFDSIELNDFTVITGLNGAGKSHLLDAIEKKHVAVDIKPNVSIVKFNYENFKLENEVAFNAYQLVTEKDNAWNFYNGNVKQHLLSIKPQLGQDIEGFSEDCKSKKIPFYQILIGLKLLTINNLLMIFFFSLILEKTMKQKGFIH
jgi:predicted ATP-binding protein involved in virulence